MLILLALAAFASGIVNALAGGGAFLTFPSLIAAGIPAIDANASSTVALAPGQFVTAWASREVVRNTPQEWKSELLSLSIISLIGGTIGAILLLVTPSQAFSKLVPWLLMFATAVFARGGRLQRGDGRRLLGPVSIKVVHGVISIYGGYFGGGIGILMLAALSIYGMRDIRQMNGMKIIFAGLMNATATIIFIIAGRVHWPETSVMMVAAMGGGYAGAKLGGILPAHIVRAAIICVGILLTIYFFLKLA
jgi:uncharacterized membrane protein YfcA